MTVCTTNTHTHTHSHTHTLSLWQVSNTPTEWVPFNGTGITQGIVHCGVKQVISL